MLFSLLLTSKVRDYLLHPQFYGKVGYIPNDLMCQKYCSFGPSVHAFIAKKYEFQLDDLPKFGKVEGFLRKNIKFMRTRRFLYRITQTLTIVDHMYSDGKIIGYYVFCDDSDFIMNLLRLSKIFENIYYGELKFDLDDLSRIPIYFSLDPERHWKALNDNRLQNFSKENYRSLIHLLLEDTTKNIGHRQKLDLIFRPMLDQDRIRLYFTNKN